MIELNARRLGLDSSATADYAALRDGVALVDLSARRRMRFSGAAARDALNGILTCDLASVGSGEGSYGVALTPKGKVIADVSVFASADGFLVEVPAAAWPGWLDMVAKFVNPRLAKRVDESETTSELGLFGPSAASLAARLIDRDASELESLPAYGNLEAMSAGESVNVARIPDLGVEGFRIVGSTAMKAGISSRAIAAGARTINAATADCARIEAGRPLWGIDMDDSTLPQEANLEALGAISYTKGCYTGQEVVARLHFRGHVNRRLVGLRIDAAHAPAMGATVTHGEGAAGDVRSSATSPRFGPIALAMVRREVEIGAAVTVPVDGVEMRAEVAALPLG